VGKSIQGELNFDWRLNAKDFDLTIGFSPMADSDNINNPLSVIDAVNNPVVSNSDTPQVLFALQLTRSGSLGSWARASILDITRRTMDASSVSNSRRAERAKVIA
jgi:hypothetical protein